MVLVTELLSTISMKENYVTRNNLKNTCTRIFGCSQKIVVSYHLLFFRIAWFSFENFASTIQNVSISSLFWAASRNGSLMYMFDSGFPQEKVRHLDLEASIYCGERGWEVRQTDLGKQLDPKWYHAFMLLSRSPPTFALAFFCAFFRTRSLLSDHFFLFIFFFSLYLADSLCTKIVVLAVRYLSVIILVLFYVIKACPWAFWFKVETMQPKETTGCTLKNSTIIVCFTGLWIVFWKSDWVETKFQSFMVI